MKLSKHKAMRTAGVVVKDPRFARLHSDPRFQRAFKRKLKIPIDSRFHHIFSDSRFSDPLALDKRGRKKRNYNPKQSKKSHALHQYYHIHDGNEAETHNQADIGDHGSGSEGEAGLAGKTLKSSPIHSSSKNHKNVENSLEAPEIRITANGCASTKKKARAQIANGTFIEGSKPEDNSIQMSEEYLESEDELDADDVSGESSDESSSDSSSSSDYSSNDDKQMADSQSDEVEEEKVPVTETETRRLALVNMDWDHIRAVDILAMLNSFLPKGGQILSVFVFPSEFGSQQMKEEEQRGPQGLFQSEGGDDEGANDGLNMERLRQYEKDKLRYYYAVVECDSVSTADFIYKSCDGMEFERTSNTLDLRFIPDDMKFLNEPRDTATEVPLDYQVPVFETRALQHSKVKLTWDDDEPDRVKTLHQKFNADQLNDMDFKAYLASESEDEEYVETIEPHEDNPLLDDTNSNGAGKGRKGSRDKYRALLLSSEEAFEGKDLENTEKDMEITFNSGLEELSKRLMEKTKQKSSDETVWEAYLRKKKEKKKLKQTRHGEVIERENADELHSGDYSADFDDPFFHSEEGMDYVASDETDSEREVPAAVQREGARALKKAELEDKKREEERSRADLELLFAEELAAGSGAKGYNLKKKFKSKKKEMEKLPERLPTVNYDDPRFAALFTSHRFAIDPTEPEYKRSAAQLRSLLEKQQKSLTQVHEVVDSKTMGSAKTRDAMVATPKKDKQELSLMVRSLKWKVGGVVES